MEKSLLNNEYAVSLVLGAILLLAIGVTLLTTIQLKFVPVWNTQEELDHINEMFDDFKGLKSSIDSSVQSGTTSSLPLSMGFKYSPKMLVYNPQESAFTSLDIQENTWAEVRYNEVFPEGMTDDTSIKNVSTSTITYGLKGAQNYNSFIYEHGIIRRSSNYTAFPQMVLANDTIYLLSVKPLGSESTSSVEKRTVNIYPTSQQKNSVKGKKVWLILHTKPEYVNWWKESIEKEETGAVRLANNSTGIVIAYIDTMVIKMGQAYISTFSKTAPAHAPPYRVIKITQDNTNLPVDGISTLVAEVQDYYNNPVPNVLVTFAKNSSRKPGNAYANATLLQDSAISGTDGRASVSLKTSGAGFYYIDANVSGNSTTFAYPASSQGKVINLYQVPSGVDYLITARLTDVFGNPQNNVWVSFDTDDGYVTPSQNQTSSGNTSTKLNVSNATGIRITNIRTSNIGTNSTTITWDTVNNITVSAQSGYIFNSIKVPTMVNTTGCVRYGTSPGNYSSTSCDTNGTSHSVTLAGLFPSTAYYFKVNSSRGAVNVNSTEYMFVTASTSLASVTNLSYTSGPLYINWTWNDPADADFDHVELYVDSNPTTTVSKGLQYYYAIYFMPNSTYTIHIRTVDTSGNANATWVNKTAYTPSVFNYVFNYSNISGSVLNFSNAMNDSDGGAFATFAEALMGVTNQDRTQSPAKSIATGTQNGTYNPSYVNNGSDGLIDKTIPVIIGTTAQTGYLMNTIKTGVGGTTYWNINRTNGVTPDTSTIIGTDSTGTYVFKPGVQNNAAGTPGTTPAGYGWVSSAPINGTTSAGAWSFQVKTNFTGNNGNGTVSVYIYKYNATSGSNTYLFNAAGTANHLANSAGTTETITSAVQPSYTFNSTEYLKVEYWLTITNAKNTKVLSFEANSAAPYVIYVTNSYSLNTTYTFTETNSSATWQSISIQDNSYGDSLTNISVLNFTSGLWETILTSTFTGGSIAAQHVNTVIGANGNASSYDAGSGQIKIRYNWTGAAFNNSLGVDLINVTVGYLDSTYRLNTTTNTTNIPEATTQVLQLRYNVSGDNFTLQTWNGSAWNSRTTLNDTVMSYRNITLQSQELIPYGTLAGNTNNINTYYALVRYLDLNASATQQGRLYIDYQRVYSY